jgi:ABC-2 type transport system ATP-binding protein
MSPAALNVQGLQRRFGDRTVLQGVDLVVAPGAVVGLLGANGAGKTTLMQCALGVLEFNAGRAAIFGEDVHALSDRVRARVGYVPQRHDLFAWATVGQVLDYFRGLYPRWNATRVNTLLDRWSLDPARRVSQMSPGEQQRLSVVRALGHDPDLLVLDEPVAALDPGARRAFLREIVDRNAEIGISVLLSTHIVSDLERIAADVALLHNGRIRLRAPLDDVKEQACRITMREPVKLPPSARLIVERAEDETRTVIALVEPAEQALLDRHPAVSLERLGLEDLMIEVTR